MLNENIHLEFNVFVILFVFQITGKLYFLSFFIFKYLFLGTIKNIILVSLANKKLDVAARAMTEESESSLSDTNA